MTNFDVLNVSQFDGLLSTGKIAAMFRFMEFGARQEGMSNAALAAFLTQYAIQKNYTQPREALFGATLKDWSQPKAKPAAWAVNAAVSFLVEMEWVPVTEREWVIWAYVLFREAGKPGLNDLESVIPVYMCADESLKQNALNALKSAYMSAEAFSKKRK
ncbi:hypothetical protein [Enterovibrio paralichthyis]|uniref:hypothetical protein n=1 Tax=Enterovibrio paralichthyis TaxID=2853805 RepID=UPI001C437FE8|nr:hypothetical protein [Enterovibrio paralichthyis]MBV7300251.1 hypothetical protein [Enterovibrio paralichthyis]